MKKALYLVLISLFIILLLGGCSAEEWELRDEGILTSYERMGKIVNFTLDDRVYAIDILRQPLRLDREYVELGSYYYLYKDTIGGVITSCPYKLTITEE